MNLDEARQFLRENHRTVLSTFRADGRPQLSPVAAAVDADGRAIVSSRETAFKVKHLRRDPRVWLCCLTKQFYGQWLLIHGRANIVSLPEAMDGLIDYYRRISGEHPDWDDYRQAMEREQRVIIRIAIERAGPEKQG